MRVGNTPQHKHTHLNQNEDNPIAGLAYEGKVIAIHPEDSSVDVAIYNGQILRRVRVLFNSANTVAGFRYLASIKNNDDAQNTPNGIVDKAIPTHISDTFATVIYVQGQTLAPRVIGFTLPNDAQMHVNEQGLAMFRHESGIYSLIDINGHHEIHYPDGSYIIAGPDTMPKQITEGQNSQPWNIPQKPNINLTIHLAQGIDINIQNGILTINGPINLAGGGQPVARKGDPVQVSVGGTLYTGQITDGSTKVECG